MNKINWNEFNETIGQEAYRDLSRRWQQTVDALAKQHADPQLVYDRYLKMHPTREATAQIIKNALRWKMSGGEVDDYET